MEPVLPPLESCYRAVRLLFSPGTLTCSPRRHFPSFASLASFSLCFTNGFRIGEKFLEWTDTDPSLDTILESVTLYWLTSSFPRAMYPYIQSGGRPTSKHPGDTPATGNVHADPNYFCEKPLGYSWFPKELAPVPVSWVKTTGNLVWHRSHESGGHFAAMERPDALLGDVEEFVAQLGR